MVAGGVKAQRSIDRRHILHIPVLAAGAVKVGSAMFLKKVAASRVLQRIGPERALAELRAANIKLRSGGIYSSKVADAAEESLTVLEEGLAGVKGEARVQKLWSFYQSLEAKNPTLAQAVMKTWLDTLPGVKWANALLKDSNSSTGSQSSSTPTADDGVPGSNAHAEKMISRLRASHPDLFAHYHVVLVPRGSEDAQGLGAQNGPAESSATSAEAEGASPPSQTRQP